MAEPKKAAAKGAAKGATKKAAKAPEAVTNAAPKVPRTAGARKAANTSAKIAAAAAAPELKLEVPAPKSAVRAEPAPAVKSVAPKAVAPKALEPAAPSPAVLETLASTLAPVAERAAATVKAAAKAVPETVAAPAARFMEAGAERARDAYAQAHATSEQLRQAVTQTASGALEVNGKVFEALRAQSDAAFDLWRQALSAGSLSEAVRVQATGARQVYETAATHWKDVAETTTRWLGSAVKPMQSAFDQRRQG